MALAACAPYLAVVKFRARVADSWYDRYRGTICHVTVEYGEMSLGDAFFTDTTPTCCCCGGWSMAPAMDDRSRDVCLSASC
jgi:hypothetical protein